MLWALRDRCVSFPESAGVYVLEDAAGGIVYVGRTADLRARLSGYADARSLESELVSMVHDVRTHPVDDGREAIVLEQELLRRHRPRLNVKPEVFDDLVYLVAETDAPEASLRIAAARDAETAPKLGPYVASSKLCETLQLVQRRFGVTVRSEHRTDDAEHGCAACRLARRCEGDASALGASRGAPDLEGALTFLAGRDPRPLVELRERMERASTQTRFEDATALRNRIDAVEEIVEGPSVPEEAVEDADVFSVARHASRRTVQILHVRDGRIRSTHHVPLDATPFAGGEVLSSVVALYYHEGHAVPETILLSHPIDDAATLGAALERHGGGSARIRTPRRGPEAELVRYATRLGERALEQAPHSESLDAGVALERLRVRLGLRRAPAHIDYFDVSHVAGSSLVVTRVSMIDGRPDPSRYWRTRSTTPDGQAPAPLYEAVSSSIRHQLDNGDAPDWILVEGGRSSLSAAVAVVRDYAASGVQVAAIARQRDDGEDLEPHASAASRVFVPGRKDAVVLPGGTPELRLLERLREEAHRYAVHRGATILRRHRALGSLHDIRGVGETRRKRLIRHFGSVDALRMATVDDLARVPGIGRSMAARIHRAVHDNDDRPAPATTALGA